MTTMVPSAGLDLPHRRRGGGRTRKSPVAYLYLLPFLIPFAIFTIFPIVYSAVLSFQFYTPNPMLPDEWIGTDNYARALGDATFWRSLANVVLLMGVVLPCQLAFGFFLASVMHAKLRNRTGLLSGIYYVPVVANLIVVTLIFQVLFQYNGLVNYLVDLLGVERVGWLTDPFWAPITTMVLIFWKGVGWYIVFLLAGLKTSIRPTTRPPASMAPTRCSRRGTSACRSCDRWSYSCSCSASSPVGRFSPSRACSSSPAREQEDPRTRCSPRPTTSSGSP